MTGANLSGARCARAAGWRLTARDAVDDAGRVIRGAQAPQMAAARSRSRACCVLARRGAGGRERRREPHGDGHGIAGPGDARRPAGVHGDGHERGRHGRVRRDRDVRRHRRANVAAARRAAMQLHRASSSCAIGLGAGPRSRPRVRARRLGDVHDHATPTSRSATVDVQINVSHNDDRHRPAAERLPIEDDRRAARRPEARDDRGHAGDDRQHLDGHGDGDEHAARAGARGEARSSSCRRSCRSSACRRAARRPA